jgi:hypothetical protein
VIVVSKPGTVIVEGNRRFPRPVEAALDRRRAEALSRAAGRVLDLSDPAARTVVARAIDGQAAAEWDWVISVAELIRFPDLSAALGAIDRLLAPGGRLLAVEPVVRPGTVRVFALAPWGVSPWVRGFHVGRDVVAALRTTTLVNDDIDRFTFRTVVAPLRHFVSVGARRVELKTEEK